MPKSLVMHEGCHLLPSVHSLNKVEQEVIGRTLGVCLYRDLIAAVSITSSISELQGSRRNISLSANNAPIELNIQNQKLQSKRLVD